MNRVGRFVSVLLVGIVVTASIGDRHVKAQAQGRLGGGTKVNVASYLRAAKVVPHTADIMAKTTAFALVVQNPDGTRYAIIDSRAVNAPKGELEIDGNLLDELNVTEIRIVDAQVDTIQSASEETTSSEDAEKDAEVGASNYEGGDGKWYMEWHNEWYHDETLYQDTDYKDTGSPAFGCANGTDQDSGIACELEHSSSYTAQISSQLTAAKLLQVGFTRGETKSTTTKFVINPVKAHSIYKATPRAERFKKGWMELSSHKRCETPSWWTFWCSGPEETLHQHGNYATGFKAITTFLALTRQSY